MNSILKMMYWMTHINIGATLALIGWTLTLKLQDFPTVALASYAAHAKAGGVR